MWQILSVLNNSRTSVSSLACKRYFSHSLLLDEVIWLVWPMACKQKWQGSHPGWRSEHLLLNYPDFLLYSELVELVELEILSRLLRHHKEDWCPKGLDEWPLVSYGWKINFYCVRPQRFGVIIYVAEIVAVPFKLVLPFYFL